MARDSFDAFCEGEWHRLVATLALYCGDVAVAEELTQETLVRVYSKWRRVRLMESPGGFAHRVAMNLATSHWRRLGAEQRAHARLQDMPPAEDDPTDGVAVRQALSRLTDPQRAAIVLRYWVGMSSDEASEALNVTPGAFRALTHRAVERLRVELAQPQPVEEGETSHGR